MLVSASWLLEIVDVTRFLLLSTWTLVEVDLVIVIKDESASVSVSVSGGAAALLLAFPGFRFSSGAILVRRS